MGVMFLGIVKGVEIIIFVIGVDENDVFNVLEEIMKSEGFGE